jgi:arginyl-tRNA synthetase
MEKPLIKKITSPCLMEIIKNYNLFSVHFDYVVIETHTHTSVMRGQNVSELKKKLGKS